MQTTQWLQEDREWGGHIVLHLVLLRVSYPITIHILKVYDVSYSKMVRGHKYKDKDNDKDNDKDKDTDKVPEKPNIYYIFEILMTYFFQMYFLY